MPPRVFISYAHEDVTGKRRDWLKRLKLHLGPLDLTENLEVWDDTRITPGSRWRSKIETTIKHSHLAVLLVGHHFLNSKFILEVELPLIIKHLEGSVLPLVLDPVDYSRTPISAFQSFNDPKTPLVKMPRTEQDEVLRDLSEAVAKRCALAQQHPDGAQIAAQISTIAIEKSGIMDGWLRLDQSPFRPLECIRRCTKSLSFLGVSAAKWVREPRFEEFLQRMNRIFAAPRRAGEPRCGLVRFLLLNPLSAAWQLLDKAGDRNARFVNEGLRALQATYPCFKLRFYNEPPSFRLTFVDELELGLAPYRFDGFALFAPGLGKEAPQLLVRRDVGKPWSLYQPFERHYEQLWSRASRQRGRRRAP